MKQLSLQQAISYLLSYRMSALSALASSVGGDREGDKVIGGKTCGFCWQRAPDDYSDN